MFMIEYCPSVVNPTVHFRKTLDEALDEIQNGPSTFIEHLRSLPKPEYDAAKRQLPTYHFNGIFATGSLSYDTFEASSGLLHFDIDHIPDTHTLKKVLPLMIPNIVFLFDSPSGKGLKGAVKIIPDLIRGEHDFKSAWAQLDVMMRQYGITIDVTCKDIRRACFSSWDPELYYNPNAAPLELTPWAPPPPPSIPKPPAPYRVNSDEGEALAQCLGVLKYAQHGERHHARLRAGRLLGGYVAGGVINERVGVQALIAQSDAISDRQRTTKTELDSLMGAVELGKSEPIYHYSLSPTHVNWQQPGTVIVPNSELFRLSQFTLNGESKAMIKELQDERFVLGKLALAGQLTVFYAKPNAGKTLITMRMLMDAVMEKVIDPNNVFYIDVDGTQTCIYLKTVICEQYGFHVLTANRKGFEVKKFLQYLRIMIEQGTCGGQIIILDTLEKFTNIMDITDQREFTNVTREFAQQGGTMIMLAHTNKHRDSSGSLVKAGTQTMADNVDCTYMIDELSCDGDSKTVVFRLDKTRGSNKREAVYSYAVTEGIKYDPLLKSVKSIDEPSSRGAVMPKHIKTLPGDKEIVDAIISAIKLEVTDTAAIIQFVSGREGYSRHKVRDVLTRYTGNDYDAGYRWNYQEGENITKRYFLV